MVNRENILIIIIIVVVIRRAQATDKKEREERDNSSYSKLASVNACVEGEGIGVEATDFFFSNIFTHFKWGQKWVCVG